MATFTKDVEEIRQRAMQKIEEGAVTDSYKLDKEQVIAILNEALATEIVCVLRYQHHYFMATGVHGRSVAALFKEHADEEREHTDEIAERIQQLGGKPNFNPGDLVNRSVSQYVEGETLADMIREDLIAERMVIDVYQRMIEYFGTKDPTTRVLIEHIKGEEEEHASELSDMMFIVNPKTGEEEGQDPGTNPLNRREERAQQPIAAQRSGSRNSGSALQGSSSGNEDEQSRDTGEETSTRDWGNESNVGKGGKGSPIRTSTAPEERGWGNEANVGNSEGGNRSRQADDRSRATQTGADMARSNSGTKRNAETTRQAGRGIDRSGNDKKNTNVTNRPDDERVTPRAARGSDISGRTEKQKNIGSGNLANALGRSAADRDTRREGQQSTRSEARGARDRGASKNYSENQIGVRGSNKPGAGNIPGVSGRPMNRRKNESLDINTDDVAERPNRGASMGTNRSPRILQKNRKSKRAA
jgi:bacterioferritin